MSLSVVSGKKIEIASPARPRQLYMIGNAHIDPVWLWRWPEGFQEVKATFRSALDRMKEYDDFVFVSSSAAYYEWLEQSDPEMFAEVQERVREGRWGLVGGWWIEPDCNIPSGESFVRQGLYGQRYFQEKFGKIARVGFNIDSFGHSARLPQILSKSGLDYYVFMRPSPHEKGLPSRLFWWESDDGSRVLAYRLPYEYCSWGKDLAKHIQRCAGEIRAPFNEQMCFYGVGNHGGGPTRENIESILKLNETGEFPGLVFATPDDFFASVESSALPIPVVHSDLQHHGSGCYSAHSAVKRWNRKAENLLLAAEKFSSVASVVAGQPYPAGLDRAWKDVLFNQFHDVLAGTCVEGAYEDVRDQYGEALAIGGRALNLAVQALAWRIHVEPEEGARLVVVFNSHAWAVRSPVELELPSLRPGDVLVDDANRAVPFQQVRSQASALGRVRLAFIADLPPLGYRVYRLVTREGPQAVPAMAATETSLENDRLRLEIDPETGTIHSLFDRQAGANVFLAAAGRPAVIDDPSDTWGHNTFTFNQEIGTFSVRSVRLVEHGPVKSVIRVESIYDTSQLIQDFTLYQDLDQVDVQVRVDWHEQQMMLKLRFPLNLNFMKATYEIPYGVIERFANGEEEPGQSWVDVTGISRDSGEPYGLSLLNDGKYSFDVAVRDLGLTVLRSPIYAHHMPVEPQPGETYRYMDQGVQEFTYSLLPHTGSWESSGTVRRAAELNQRPVTLPATFHPDGALPQAASFLSVDRPNIIVSVLKQAEAGDDLILRVYETSHEATRVIICLPFLNRVIEANFDPSEIKTYRVPREASQPVVETNMLEMDI